MPHKPIENVADPFNATRAFGVGVVRYHLAWVGGQFRDDIGRPKRILASHSTTPVDLSQDQP
ncbi:hypothetical protein BD779DRAFT_319167 [Infundibulicybe gibba]|nr:hypothetical protein BD779DRAFT_319167 [Infundibulicybe gibba]